MSKDSAQVIYLDFVRGEMIGLRQIILGLANLLLDREEFRDESLQRIEMARTGMLPTKASEQLLAGLDETERWLRDVSG